MKKTVIRTIALTMVCFMFTALPGTAFWSSRVQATAEETLLTTFAGSIPIIQPIKAETVSNVMIEIQLTANDADGDPVAFQIVDAPRKGTAYIENDKLYYTPAEGETGTDKFTYCALDVTGNHSSPAQIKVKIKKNNTKLTYADMKRSPYHLAALSLHEAGIITGEKIGTSYFFHPNDNITRSEFIAMAVAAGGYDLIQTSQTDFIDDEGLSEWAKTYVSTAAANGLISGYQTVPGAAEIRGSNLITLDEASAIICSLVSPHLEAPIAAVVPTEATHWAASSNAVLTAANILTEHETVSGNEPITRETACKLIYDACQIIK